MMRSYTSWSIEYNTKADYAHQCITTSAILAESVPSLAPIAGLFTSGMPGAMSGWLGDATLLNIEGKPNLGNDDYHADLDAANICDYMKKQNLSFKEAYKQYYNDIDTGKSRADIFLSHTPLDTVEKLVVEQLFIPHAANDGTEEKAPHEMNTEERREWIKINFGNTDTYAFIEALRNGQNDL